MENAIQDFKSVCVECGVSGEVWHKFMRHPEPLRADLREVVDHVYNWAVSIAERDDRWALLGALDILCDEFNGEIGDYGTERYGNQVHALMEAREELSKWHVGADDIYRLTSNLYPGLWPSREVLSAGYELACREWERHQDDDLGMILDLLKEAFPEWLD